MPGGWMPQATRLPFASRTGMHTQAGRRSPRRTGSPVTALKTWLGFVLYLRNVTPWKEHLNYKRPGPPGCLLAQAGPQPGGRPGARPLPEPGACVPGPAPLRLCAPEAGHPGTHTLASPRGLAKHSTNRSSAVGTESSGCPETRHPASPKATVPAGPPLVLESPLNASWTSVCRRLQGKAEPEPRLRGWGQACAGTAPCAPCGVQCVRSANTREGPASTRHEDPEPSVQDGITKTFPNHKEGERAAVRPGAARPPGQGSQRPPWTPRQARRRVWGSSQQEAAPCPQGRKPCPASGRRGLSQVHLVVLDMGKPQGLTSE